MKTRENSKSRRAVLCTLGIVIAVAAVVLFLIASGPKMPRYKGRSVESWLREAATGSADAVEAFQSMGKNGFLHMVGTIDRRSSRLELTYQRLYNKLPMRWRSLLPRPVDARSLAADAEIAILHIRDPAPEQTLPELVRMLSSSRLSVRRASARLIVLYQRTYPNLDLALFRPELTRALTSADDWTRIDLVQILGKAGVDRAELIPALRPALTNSNHYVRKAAEWTLNIYLTRYVPNSLSTP